MAFSNTERLIITMLCDIYEKLDIKDSFDPRFVRSAIYYGHDWALSWKYQGVFDVGAASETNVSFVVNVLDMWSILEESAEQLTLDEKMAVDGKIDPFTVDSLRFAGFDGNNETEYMSITRFMVEELGRFSRFKGRSFNCHHPSIDTYRRMYDVYAPKRAGLADRLLNAEEIAEIMLARVHPSHRKTSPTPLTPPGSLNSA
jgi:uncharacterized protein